MPESPCYSPPVTWDLTYALAEEIGDPDLFVGREKELARLLKWAAGAKRRISKSMGILSRRKKGKTALLQRFFNVLYTRNDPQLIPFYYRIPEGRLKRSDFARMFYRRQLSQYFAFTTRTPEWVNRCSPSASFGTWRAATVTSRTTCAAWRTSSRTRRARPGNTRAKPPIGSRRRGTSASFRSSTSSST
jgi:hypothetical protein